MNSESNRYSSAGNPMLIHEMLLRNVVGGLWVTLSAVGTADCARIFSHTLNI